MGSELNEARRTYDRLWNGAVPAFERNEFEVNRHLLDRPNDLRRGLSLALRPSRTVRDSLNDFLHGLAVAAPGQYFYRPEELHVTVLTIIPGSKSWQDKFHHLADYQAIIDEVLKRHRKFSIKFQGVTATPGAVMIQGFPSDDTLAQIRDDLREIFHQNGFGGQLDARYKINTAHMTVMRFSHAKTDGKNLLAFLNANRTTGFGETPVADLELIFGDWYASAGVSRTIQEYRL